MPFVHVSAYDRAYPKKKKKATVRSTSPPAWRKKDEAAKRRERQARAKREFEALVAERRAAGLNRMP